jgi:hypothetical protein
MTIPDEIRPTSSSSEDSVNSTFALIDPKYQSTDSSLAFSFPFNAALNAGSRAFEAFVRPSPIVVAGTPKSYGFDMKSCTFSMTMMPFESQPPEDAPTEIFIPEYFFEDCEAEVTVSSGRFMMVRDAQVLRWWHSGSGVQSLKVASEYTKEGVVGTVDSDEAWYYYPGKCRVM